MARQRRGAPTWDGRARWTSGGARHGTDPLTAAAAVLALQRTAGNQAVVARLDGGAVAAWSLQRQPKPGTSQPTWVTEARQELALMFPNDPHMAKVVIKDYATLNATLQGASFDAWTQSRSEIYLRDLSRFADPSNPKTKRWPLFMMRYVLRHEAEHIRQFAGTGGGAPTTWKAMLGFEKEAYTKDIAWLAGAGGKKAVPDATLRAALTASARTARGQVRAALKKGAKQRGDAAAKEKARFDEMKRLKLIPAGADPDPTKLYVQPP